MAAWFRTLLEGRRGGILSLAVRLLLLPFGLLYGSAIALRTKLFATGYFATHRPGIPVISIGNLTVGGTGKTPFVILICQRLIAAGERPAILTRGYGATTPDQADEPKLFAAHLPDTPVLIAPNRVASAKQAEQDGATVLVLDDGFQHLHLARDLDIVLLDATCPWGGGWPLPAGLLREFIPALRRADLICLTRTDQADAAALAQLRATLARRVPNVPLLEATHAPSQFITLAGDVQPLETLRGKPVIAVSGIGQPAAFIATLRDLGGEIKQSFGFSDHHIYSVNDLKTLRNASLKHRATLVTTEKDAVKLRPAINNSETNDTFDAVLVLNVTISIMDETALTAALSRYSSVSE